MICAVIYILCATFYIICSSGERQKWDNPDKSDDRSAKTEMKGIQMEDAKIVNETQH